SIKSFFLRLGNPFTHVAGQHVDVRLTAPDGYTAMRSYSIASSPASSPILELAIERLHDGEVSPFFHDIAATGDEIELQASVTNATNPELSWEAGQGGWRGDARLIEAGAILDVPAVWERTHATPSSTSDFPYLITLEATASTGLRADGEPPRRAVVEVRLKELVIEPDPGGVLVNRSIQFVARGADGNVADVTWSATGGTIDANGVYTAGKRPGTYTVTAVSKIDLNIRATATVIVGEADCIAGTWRLRSQDFLDQIGQAVGEPGAYQHLGGEYVVVMSDDGGFRGERRTWQFAVAALGQQLEVTINSVEIGTWSIDAANRTMTIDESSSDATVSMTVNGRELPIGTQAIQSPALSGAATYECDGDVLTTTITDAGTEITATLDRIG
ncbi:MAG TPA: FAD-binding oxidoreductase, partial [Ilumatobacteraceae bacterium]|nr:FAD-binding oxidoreductase [Ilumatobacteraceae bacterium]